MALNPRSLISILIANYQNGNVQIPAQIQVLAGFLIKHVWVSFGLNVVCANLLRKRTGRSEKTILLDSLHYIFVEYAYLMQ